MNRSNPVRQRNCSAGSAVSVRSGGFCGGLLAERVAAWFGAGGRRPVARHPSPWVRGSALEHSAGPGGRARTTRPRESNPIDAVQRYPFLLTLAGLVIAASAGTAALDFVFKAQAAHTIGRGAPLLRFFGLYYTGASLLTFLLQAFVTRVCVKHAGLAVTTGTLPAAVSLGSLTALLLPGFPALSAIRGMEILMRGSLYRSAYELFYTAVGARRQARRQISDRCRGRAGWRCDWLGRCQLECSC